MFSLSLSLSRTLFLMKSFHCLLNILFQGKNSTYNIVNEYECLPCAEGCDSCEDGSPCIAALNWPMRTSILALACVVIGLLPPAAWFTFRYQQVKVCANGFQSTFLVICVLLTEFVKY